MEEGSLSQVPHGRKLGFSYMQVRSIKLPNTVTEIKDEAFF